MYGHIHVCVMFACIGDVYVQIHTHLRACVAHPSKSKGGEGGGAEATLRAGTMYLRELSTSTYWDFVSQTKLGSCVPKYACVLPAAICLCGTF